MTCGQDAFSYLDLERDRGLKHRDCMSVKAALVSVIGCIKDQKGVSAAHQELVGNGVLPDMDFYAFSAEFGMSRSPQRVDHKQSAGTTQSVY